MSGGPGVQTKVAHDRDTPAARHLNPQALLLSVCRAGLYIPVYTQRSEPSLPESMLICVSDLTEVGNPMISRVNNDVT